MRIRSLKLENYRGFRDTTLDLDRDLTVLVGVNGCGKSSVLSALAIACSKVVTESLPGQRVQRWHFEDVDVRAGADVAAVTANFANAGSHDVVRVEHRRFEGLAEVVWRPWSVHQTAPFLPVFYVATRKVAHWTRAFEAPTPAKELRARADIYDAANPSESDGIAFGSLFRWFKEREDIENETRVTKQDLTLEDPQLRAVRRAVEGMLPGFTGLRVQRDPLHLVVRKGAEVLALDQLSDGEKLLLAMTADLARRLAIAYADAADPLAGEALVLIDEIELHLHAKWQRTALVNLRKTFPGCQLIVTTHSPQVLSTVPRDSVLLLDDFQVVRLGLPTEGRDSNAILREVLDVPERPQGAVDAVRQADRILDGGDVDDARRAIDALEERLGGLDEEVVRLRTRLEFLAVPLVG